MLEQQKNLSDIFYAINRRVSSSEGRQLYDIRETEGLRVCKSLINLSDHLDGYSAVNEPLFYNGTTALGLLSYCTGYRIVIAQVLLDVLRADIEARDEYNYTALMLSIKNRAFPYTKYLLKSDADAEATRHNVLGVCMSVQDYAEQTHILALLSARSAENSQALKNPAHRAPAKILTLIDTHLKTIQEKHG